MHNLIVLTVAKQIAFEYFSYNFRVYQDKLAGIQKQLQQLRDGTHGEYVKQLKKLDAQHKNE